MQKTPYALERNVSQCFHHMFFTDISDKKEGEIQVERQNNSVKDNIMVEAEETPKKRSNRNKAIESGTVSSPRRSRRISENATKNETLDIKTRKRSVVPKDELGNDALAHGIIKPSQAKGTVVNTFVYLYL